MGGFVTIATAAVHGDGLTGVIICDSPVTAPDPEVESYRLKEAFGAPRTYASVDDAVARFRTVPPQDHYLDYVIDHVARRSLKPVCVEADDTHAGGVEVPAGTAMSACAKSHEHGGWQWKFDRRIFEQFAGGMRGIAMPYLGRVRCRFALLRSECGLVTPDIGRSMYEALGRVAPVIEIPEAGHHAMLDQPLVLLTALRTLLADWDHSEPHRPRSA
jgi:pimeloyl-ACP methyl ester carboxylesterase